MKAVLLSVKPKWCKLIFSGKKTIEVRKTAPKLETPFTVYVYCTKERMTRVPSMYAYLHKNEPGACAEYGTIETWGKIGDVIVNPHLASKHVSFGMHGKVIGEFVCDRIICCQAYYGDSGKKHLTNLFGVDTSKICLSELEIFDYIIGKDKKDGIGWLWHISDLKIYEKPKELGEFGNYKTEWIQWYHSDDKVFYPLTRPPQSWCYVEELQ